MDSTLEETNMNKPRSRRAEFYTVLKKCRVSIISVVLVSLLSFLPQAREAFCSMAQSWSQFVIFEIALIFWAISVWACGRLILNHDFDAARLKTSSKDNLYNLLGERYVPQILGAISFIIIILSLFKSIKGINSSNVVYYISINIIILIVFFVFYITYLFDSFPGLFFTAVRKITIFKKGEFKTSGKNEKELCNAISERLLNKKLNYNENDEIKFLNSLLENISLYEDLEQNIPDKENGFIESAKDKGYLGLSRKEKYKINKINRLILEKVFPDKTPKMEGRIADVREYSGVVKTIIGFALGCSIICWILFCKWPFEATSRMGTLPTLMFGCTFLIIIFTLLAWFGERFQLPVLTFILMMVIILGIIGLNNNHDVRQSDTKLSESPENFFTPGGLYESWLKKMDIEYKTETVHPMFIVAASGGGIRAAYWTASVLGMLQDLDKSFASHTIVISPVSGSALGSLVFANLVVENVEQGKYAETSQTVLSRDFLAPALASFFFYDLPTRFIPFPFKSIPDRAEILEKAWERAWDPKNSNNSSENLLKDFLSKESPFAKPFSSLLQAERDHKIPVLLINGTIVENGERIITAHLNMNEKKEINEFSYCKNLFTIPPFNSSDIRMSTAAMMSARFPIISPAGTIDADNSEYHVVDGGYFDNSGTATALDFYESIKPKIERDKGKVIPFFIQIDNSETDENRSLTWWNRIFPGLQLPLIALYNAGDAHANDIQKWIVEEFTDKKEGQIKYFQYTLNDKNEGGDINIPLSWFLSRESQKCIQSQLKEAKNGTVTAEIIKLLPKVSKQEMNIRIDIE